jgi:hypothetical protein
VLKQVAEKGLGRGLEKCSLRRKDSELRLKCPFSVFFVARLDVECQIPLAAAVWWILGQNKRYTGHLRGYGREKNQFHRPRVNNALFGASRTVHVALRSLSADDARFCGNQTVARSGHWN